MSIPFKCPVCGHEHNMPKTNADRIRAMTDEELAAFLNSTEVCEKQPLAKCAMATTNEFCEACTLEWLRQPAKGE